MTREHVYPQFLYAGSGARSLGYLEAADAVVPGERVVKDVCSKCNGGPLHSLDDYGKSYCLENRINETFREEREALVRYNYDLLLRWVLKISYNSFRTLPCSVDPFRSLIPFILQGSPKPKTKFVKLAIELIRDHKFTEEELPRMQPEFQERGYLPCQILRTGRAVGLSPVTDFLCRHFQVNAHLFTVFLFPYSTNASVSSSIAVEFMKTFPFARFLDPGLDRTTVPVSERDMVQINTEGIHPKERLAEARFRQQPRVRRARR